MLRVHYACDPCGRVVAVDDFTGGTPPYNALGHQGLFYYRLDAGPFAPPLASPETPNRQPPAPALSPDSQSASRRETTRVDTLAQEATRTWRAFITPCQMRAYAIQRETERRGGDSNPRYRFTQYDGLANRYPDPQPTTIPRLTVIRQRPPPIPPPVAIRGRRTTPTWNVS
jgi:hypothetical protein